MGWRHAKRPGVDKFLQTLSSYYEIALFSDNDNITGEEVWANINGENRCHRLHSNAGEIRGNRILKRLDKMNRDIRKIILIDDNKITSQLCERNTLLVKPYTNLSDRSDTVLLDLIPLLQALVHEGCTDFRDAIDNLGTHDAQEAAIEYQMRVAKSKEVEFERRNKGLGKLIRQPKSTDESSSSSSFSSSNQTSILSAKDIVGLAPIESRFSSSSSSSDATPASSASKKNVPEVGYKPSSKPADRKTGALFEWIDSSRKEKEELEMRKREKMNEIYQKRMEEKMAKQQPSQSDDQFSEAL